MKILFLIPLLFFLSSNLGFAGDSIEIVKFSPFNKEPGHGYALPGGYVKIASPIRCAHITVRYNSTSLSRYLTASDFTASFANGGVKKGESWTVAGKSDPRKISIRSDEILSCIVCFGKDDSPIIQIEVE